MSEATIHTIPTEVSIVEDIHTVFDDVKTSYHRNRDVCIMVGVTIGALFVYRAILRRELKRLQFTIEVLGDIDIETMPDYFGSD